MQRTQAAFRSPLELRRRFVRAFGETLTETAALVDKRSVLTVEAARAFNILRGVMELRQKGAMEESPFSK